MTLNDMKSGVMVLDATNTKVTDELWMEQSTVNVAATEMLRVWWEALGPDYEFLSTYIAAVLEGQKAVADYQTSVEQLDASLNQEDAKNIGLWSGYLLNTLSNYVSKVERAARDRAGRFEDEGRKDDALLARNDHRKALLLETRIEQTKISQHLRTAVATATELVQQIQASAESAQTAAGFVSGAKLADRFETLSQDQLKTAWIFRLLTVIGVALGVAGTFFLAFLPAFAHGAATTTGDAILRVSLLGAVLGLATYFGRQAAYHRDQGTWARTIKEQLLTFDGYVDPLKDQDLKDHLRAAFASRVFGSSPESKDDSGVTLSSAFMSDLLAAAGKSAANAAKP